MSKPQGIASYIVATFCFLAGCLLVMNMTIIWALRAEAIGLGLHWSRIIQDQINEASAEIGVSLAERALGGNPNLALIADLISADGVFQIDLIDLQCACATSFTVTDFAPTSPDRSTPIEITTGTLLADLRAPIEDEIIDAVAADMEPRIMVDREGDPFLPPMFFEVYSVINRGDGSVQVLRQLINRTDLRVHYIQLFLFAFVALTVLLFAFFWYPVRSGLRRAKLQKAADVQSRFLARNDILTGLLNRNGFQEMMPIVFERCKAEGRSLDVILFDLDSLKDVNDFHSHQAGDELLRSFAKALKDEMPARSHISRIGGDEFAVLIEGTSDIECTTSIDVTLPTTVQHPTEPGSDIFCATVSAGRASFPKDASSFNELLRHADLALYAAKVDRNGSVCVFEPEMGKRFIEKINLRQDFQKALTQGEIKPYYQPLKDIESGEVHGFEALARWYHPEKGVLTPSDFGELFDDPAIGPMIGSHMLDCIVNDMKSWNEAGVHFRCIGLNVAACDLRRPDFAKTICEKLEQNGIDGKALALEITENCLLGANKEIYTKQLNILKHAGCWISLDDFGTGYSSITQIKELPVSGIKIDKSFIDGVLVNHSDQAIVSAMVDLGASLGFHLIAEGIEDAAQRDFVYELGIKLAQGYYVGRPMPACEVRQFIVDNYMYHDDNAA